MRGSRNGRPALRRSRPASSQPQAEASVVTAPRAQNQSGAAETMKITWFLQGRRHHPFMVLGALAYAAKAGAT
jgi:hypothetical protein